MDSKKIWVIVTGLVRKPNYFMPSLQIFIKARELGLIEGVVFSTWRYEVDNYEDLRSYLHLNQVILVENDQLSSPTAGLAGNIERQKYLLSWGLSCVPNDAFVFKTRPDQVITMNDKFLGLISYLSALDFSVSEEDRSLLPSKIWCGRFAPNIPFWFDDRYFFTEWETAFRMTHTPADIRLVSNANNSIAEINWYQPLFAFSCYWATAILRIDWVRLAQQPDQSAFEAYKDKLKRGGDIYWLSIALYEQVTDRFFYLGYDGFNITDYDHLGSDPHRPAELPMSYDRFLDFHPGFDRIFAYSEAKSLCSNLLSKTINDPFLWHDMIADFAQLNPDHHELVIQPTVS